MDKPTLLNPNIRKPLDTNGRIRRTRLDIAILNAGRDPMREIFELLDDPAVKPQMRLRAWIDMLPYIYPKAKEEASEIDKIREELAALTREQLAERLEKELSLVRNSG